MAYITKKMSFEEAKNHIQDYEYALLYEISNIWLTRVESLAEIDWEECTEARFFNETGELHLFEMDGSMTAIEVKDAGKAEDEVVKKYDLAKKFQNEGTKVCVKEYLGYDTDGQAEVVLTRLMRVE